MFEDGSDAGLGVFPGTTSQVDPASAWPIAGDAGIALGTGAGQHGFAPQAGGRGIMGNGLQGIVDWLNAPLKNPWSPTSIFIFIGTVFVTIIVWNLILYHLRIAAEAI